MALDSPDVKKYLESLGFDRNLLEFEAQTNLIYEIMIPNDIGKLNKDCTKQIVDNFIKDPHSQSLYV